jgi:hypothetical protein
MHHVFVNKMGDLGENSIVSFVHSSNGEEGVGNIATAVKVKVKVKVEAQSMIDAKRRVYVCACTMMMMQTFPIQLESQSFLLSFVSFLHLQKNRIVIVWVTAIQNQIPVLR